MSHSIPPRPASTPAFAPRESPVANGCSPPTWQVSRGHFHKVWSVTRKLDHLWYQLQRPDIAALQQFVNCALQDNEQVQVIATIVVTAERTLRVLDALKRIESTLRHVRRTWNLPSADSYPMLAPCEKAHLLQRMLAKVRRLAKIYWLLIVEIFQLGMYLLDIREALTWNEQNRKERVRHMIIDIARLCESASTIRESLRGEKERADWWLAKIGSPLRADRLYFILNQVDQFC